MYCNVATRAKLRMRTVGTCSVVFLFCSVYQNVLQILDCKISKMNKLNLILIEKISLLFFNSKMKRKLKPTFK